MAADPAEVEALTAKLAAAEGKIAAEEEACRALAARVSALEAALRHIVNASGYEDLDDYYEFVAAAARAALATAPTDAAVACCWRCVRLDKSCANTGVRVP